MIKKMLLAACSATILLSSCSTKLTNNTKQNVLAQIDLVNLKDDMVKVELNPGKFTDNQVKFYMPQIIPGTYQNSNFGKFIQNLKAYDYDGNEITTSKEGDNTWLINNGSQLDKITYWVEDTYDAGEKAKGIYPMEGTSNIEGEVFLLNLHGYIGYFNDLKEVEYQLSIQSPADLKPHTTLNQLAHTATNDVYQAKRYFEIIDNPILYNKSESVGFDLDDIRVYFAVYSPNGKHKATDYAETLKKMMTAQKAFLGNANSTKQYDVLLYLATPEEITQFNGILGALEHHTSTVVVFADSSPADSMKESITDVVSHEFFHTLTPLNVHSEEIHYFDYNNPKLSQHLWMYEGATEYFSNLFQVNQGLIGEDEFLLRMAEKITSSKNFDDSMSFTTMSANVTQKAYEKEYSNVYLKGALINMCIDILVREKSNGQKGIIDVMTQLANKYGVDKPFKDANLIAEYTQLTYPEVGAFFETHVVGSKPINYDYFFDKVGIGSISKMTDVPGVVMASSNAPFFTPDSDKKLLKVSALNSSLKKIGLQKGDYLLSFNDVDLTDLQNNQPAIQNLFQQSFTWDANKDISFKVKRGDKELSLKGKVGKPQAQGESLGVKKDATAQQNQLREAWLNN